MDGGMLGPSYGSKVTQSTKASKTAHSNPNSARGAGTEPSYLLPLGDGLAEFGLREWGKDNGLSRTGNSDVTSRSLELARGGGGGPASRTNSSKERAARNDSGSARTPRSLIAAAAQATYGSNTASPRQPHGASPRLQLGPAKKAGGGKPTEATGKRRQAIEELYRELRRLEDEEARN